MVAIIASIGFAFLIYTAMSHSEAYRQAEDDWKKQQPIENGIKND